MTDFYLDFFDELEKEFSPFLKIEAYDKKDGVLIYS